MSEANVEVVRRAIEAFNRRDFDVALRDAAPDATFDMSHSLSPDAGVYVGHDAVRRLWTDLTEPFERHAMAPHEFIPHGEYVVVPMTSRMTGRGGIEVEAKSAWVTTLCDGRMVRWTMYQDRTEALKAVGLEPYPVTANLDLVRSIYADWERGDFIRSDWADPDIECVIADGPAPGRWTGASAMAAAWRDFMTAWEDWRVYVDDLRDLDSERVLVLEDRSARAKKSGLRVGEMSAETRSKGASLFHLRDGKATRFVTYFDRDRALTDLGLTPD